MNSVDMVKEIMMDVRMKLVALNYEMTVGPLRNKMMLQWGVLIKEKSRNSIWFAFEKPLHGIKKLNTDGALQNGYGRWGAVRRDCQGTPVSLAHGQSPYTLIDAIELDDVAYGIELALRKGYQQLVINTDSITVLQYIRMEKPP